MAFYTIVPIEQLFDEDNDVQEAMTVKRGHLTMEVETVYGSVGKVRRIISSDPQDFLDERWQPGALLDLQMSDYTV